MKMSMVPRPYLPDYQQDDPAFEVLTHILHPKSLDECLGDVSHQVLHESMPLLAPLPVSSPHHPSQSPCSHLNQILCSSGTPNLLEQG